MLNLKTAMDEKKISITAISKALGIHRNSASNKICGETPFTVNESLKLWSDYFSDYRLDWLFSERESPKRKQDSA